MSWFDADTEKEPKPTVEQLRSIIDDLSQDKMLSNTVLSNMTEGVVAVDLHGRVLLINSAMAEIFGVRTEDARGRIFLEAVRHNHLNDLIQFALREGKPKTSEVHVFSANNLMFEAHVVPLIEQGINTGALLVLRDITQLRHLEKVRRDFVANVSHELRTPLASIKGFAETLREGALDDRKHALEFLESIEKNTDNMIALVQDLLDLTSIESGQRIPKIEAISLSSIVTEVLVGLKPLIRKKSIEIKNELLSTETAVLADKHHMKQVLVNLIENAVKFNSVGGWVRVSSETGPTHLRLIISDNGPGIPAQDTSRIFERFYRSDVARSREVGGTGLGLSIVKHLIEANHGSVTVESSVGKGSQFSIFLPVI